MNKFIVGLSALAVSAVFVSHAWAEPAGAMSKIHKSTASGSPETIVYDAASAMEFLRSLAGDWSEEPTGDSKPVGYGETKIDGTTFRTMAAGSAVAERYLAGSPYEMEIVYTMDGPDTLKLVHYCSAKNAPQQKFVKTGKPGEIKFVFDGGANLNPAVDAHFHAVTYQIVNKDTYLMTATGMNMGKETITHGIVKRKAVAEASAQK